MLNYAPPFHIGSILTMAAVFYKMRHMMLYDFVGLDSMIKKSKEWKVRAIVELLTPGFDL